MALNGIDVSSWQKGINLYAVPADFVIVKATENVNYTSPTFRAQADATLGSGKLLGVYHYIGGGNAKTAKAEANYFVDAIRPYIGKCVIALDFEAQGNRSYGDFGYLEAVAKEVFALTGVRPLLYGSAKDYRGLAGVGKRQNCGLWIAQYPNYNSTGYQNTPWNEGAYACAIRQYASSGRLPGYGGNLDLNKFYGDVNAWKAYSKSVNAAPPAPPVPPAPPTPPTPPAPPAPPAEKPHAKGDGMAVKEDPKPVPAPETPREKVPAQPDPGPKHAAETEESTDPLTMIQQLKKLLNNICDWVISLIKRDKGSK